MLKLPRRYHLLPALIALFSVQQTQAFNYGIYDSRAMAMGGTAVAVGNTSQAQFYNPALLAFHDGDEDKTRDGRFYFPAIVAQVANTIDSAVQAADDNLDTELSDAVSGFNAAPDATSAGIVAAGANDLRDVLGKIANKDLTVDSFIGLSVSEPGDREGGAFYMGARLIGAGTSAVTAEDLALLDEYIAAMGDIAGGASLATVAAQHPNLIDANGQLIDPTLTLTSTADVSGLGIGEWGLALAKEFKFWGHAVSFGFTPKMMRVDAYRERADFNNSNTLPTSSDNLSDTKSSSLTFNADFGIAAIIYDHYRVSFAIKDAFAKNFNVHQPEDPVTGIAPPDLIVKLHPRSRLGVGYVNDSFSIGLDYDLEESTPIANEAPSQEISLGAEYKIFESFALRAGYRQDKTGLHGNLITGGFGYQYRRFVIDMSYGQSSDIKAGGLQLGWAF